MADYMNTALPPSIPVRPGGESRDVLARLVLLTGEERFESARAVRYTPTHTMVRLSDGYVWLRNDDVTG